MKFIVPRLGHTTIEHPATPHMCAYGHTQYVYSYSITTDFALLFESSPGGNIGFEPGFKFTQEMLDVIWVERTLTHTNDIKMQGVHT